MAGSSRKLSFIEFYGDQEDNQCGYCHGPNGSFTQSMWAHQMTAADYQDLIDRGWRRSGKYCYKPRMNRTCCPSYTIRCAADQFRLSKSQKKVIKNLQRCLHRGLSSTDGDKAVGDDGEPASGGCPETKAADYERCPQNAPDLTVEGCLDERQVVGTPPTHSADLANQAAASQSKKSKLAEAEPANRTVASGDGPDAAKPLQKKAKLLRLERRAAKLQKLTGEDSAEGVALESASPAKPATAAEPAKTLTELLAATETAGDPPKHRLTLKLLSAEESLETTGQLLPLYQKYQHRVHGDNPAELRLSGFRRFLVDSPLAAEHGPEAPACGFGTFHQQYWLDERQLIAVAVLDILPRCVSAVYFFYDPDVRELSLGTYSALREVELVQRLRLECPALRFYYMGYYIQSCAKMRYKANVRPSELLCPEAYTWHAITEELTARLEASKYQRLDPDAESRDADAFRLSPDLNNVLMVHQRQLATYKQVCGEISPTTRTGGKVKNEQIREMLEYGQIVGRALSARMVFTS